MNNSDESSNTVPDGWTASTYLNPSVKTFSDVSHRIKLRLGYPSNDLNITDEAIANHINESLEVYSRFAGYDEEYVIFCDEMLSGGCEVKLDDLVNSCYSIGNGNTLSSDSALIYDTFVSATNVTDTLIGTSESLISFETSLSSQETQFVNSPSVNTEISKLELTYDSSIPWTFSVCDTNRVVITALSAYDTPKEKTPLMDVWVDVSNGEGKIYPPNWETLDPCLPLSGWWGVSTQLSSFNPETATHVEISGVPTCTIGGTQSLVINTGRGATFRVADKSINTCGYINAKAQFIDSYSPPTELSGSFGVDNNTGFKLLLDSKPDEFPDIKIPIPMNVEFYNSLSSFEYGVSAREELGFVDNDLNTNRKITNVFFVDSAGTSHNNLLFSFDYMLTQQILGYDGMGGRMGNLNSNGYDLVTYDLSRQFIETVDKYFGGGTIGFQFNNRTQMLKVFKNNRCNNGCYLLGVHIEKPIETMLSEHWVIDYTTALVKETIGNTLTKFGGATTLGGLTINGNDILAQGIEERKILMDEIRVQNSEGGLRTPVYIY